MNENMTLHLKNILTKMCEYVNVDFNTIDFKEHEWFLKHAWTTNHENDFKEWMVDYLSNNKEAQKEIMNIETTDKKRINATVGFFLFTYGWKTEDVK